MIQSAMNSDVEVVCPFDCVPETCVISRGQDDYAPWWWPTRSESYFMAWCLRAAHPGTDRVAVAVLGANIRRSGVTERVSVLDPGR